MIDYQNYNWIKERFLVADDDHSSTLLLEKILTKTGASVLVASNGQQALDIIKKELDISLAIIDINMPVLDGYEVIEQAREFRSDLIFIACTADVVRVNSGKCIDLGFAACITKPFFPANLFSVLEEALILRQ